MILLQCSLELHVYYYSQKPEPVSSSSRSYYWLANEDWTFVEQFKIIRSVRDDCYWISKLDKLLRADANFLNVVNPPRSFI